MLARTDNTPASRARSQGPRCQASVLTFAAIERKRARLNVKVGKLLGLAGVARTTWAAVRNGQGHSHPQRQTTLARLDAALESLRAQSAPKLPPSALRAFVRAVEIILRPRIEADPALIEALGVRYAGWKAPGLTRGRLRTLALYIVSVEFCVANAELGRAVGCERQNVKQARDQVENLRSAAAADEFLEAIAAEIREGAP